jgi:SAM-dependent methyltransferase
MDGAERALVAIDPARQHGVEIGPLTRPLVTRSMGSIKYIDRAPRHELLQWYANNPDVDPEKIVDIDYVWGDKSLIECMAGEQVDYCIASHVIEHVPDLITWLAEVAEILRPGGILSLVVPDRRYTFDILRRTSGVAEAVDAYVNRLRKPNPRQIFDHFSNFTKVDAQAVWSGKIDPKALRPQEPPASVLALAKEARQNGRYIDVHCWVFTPESFLELLADIATLGLLDFEVAHFFATAPGTLEFHASLRRLPGGMDCEQKKRTIRGSLWGAQFQDRLFTRGS